MKSILYFQMQGKLRMYNNTLHTCTHAHAHAHRSHYVSLPTSIRSPLVEKIQVKLTTIKASGYYHLRVGVTTASERTTLLGQVAADGMSSTLIPSHLEALCKPQYLCKRQPTTTSLTCHTVNATAASETVTVFTMCSFRTHENTASFLYLFTIKNSIVTY